MKVQFNSPRDISVYQNHHYICVQEHKYDSHKIVWNESISFGCNSVCDLQISLKNYCMLNIFLQNILLHGRSATITQQSLIGYGFAATPFIKFVNCQEQGFPWLAPRYKRKISLGLNFPRNKADCPYCNSLYLLHRKKRKEKDFNLSCLSCVALKSATHDKQYTSSENVK